MRKADDLPLMSIGLFKFYMISTLNNILGLQNPYDSKKKYRITSSLFLPKLLPDIASLDSKYNVRARLEMERA